MTNSNQNKNFDVPTALIKDKKNNELLCFLEQIVPIEGIEYALLTPVDTPVSLFKLHDSRDPEFIERIESDEPILEVADIVLQEHELTLVRSAVTLTVSGELEEPDIEDFEEDEDEDLDDESETYELLINFRVGTDEYGLYIPLDPFFIVGKLIEGDVKLVEGEEFDKIQEQIELELEERELSD